MRRIASFILFIYCSLTLMAQNNTVKPMYVSDNMARKIVVYIDNAWPRENGANVMWLFKMANNISSTYECDKILEAIILHKDKVENFIVYVINNYGKENSYSVFRNIGYSTFEYEMALKIYDNWLVENEVQQKAYEDYYHKTQKEYEQKTIDNWQKHGKDTLMAYSVNAPVFTVSLDGFKDPIIVYQDVSLNKKNDMRQSDLSDKYFYRTITEDKLFSFFVNENGEISNLDTDNNWLNGINEINTIKPGYKHFDELDTTVYVPTQN